MENICKYDYIIAYGIGQNYARMKKHFMKDYKIDFVMDVMWEQTNAQNYQGIPIIRYKDIYKLKDMKILIIVFPENNNIFLQVKEAMSNYNVDVKKVIQVVGGKKTIMGDELKNNYAYYYEDEFDNKIYFDETIPINISITFKGENSVIYIGKNINVIDKINIVMGNDGECQIGEGTSICEAELNVSGASLIIGKECLISKGIVIRTHDGHHIFDAETKQRINYPQDIIIEDKVWIGHNAALLPRARIGKGSILGYGAVTSSDFGRNKLIVGCPAKAIKDNVIWSRDNTDWFNQSCINDCIDKSSLNYLTKE